MTTQQWPLNTQVKITEVSEVEGNKGKQWKLTCEFPWTGRYPEIVWVDIDLSSDWRPLPGTTYAAIVNRRDLKKDRDGNVLDENTEWNWRHYINGFYENPNLQTYHKPGYSAPSNQSPSVPPQGDASPAPVELSSGTINDKLQGSEFGMLFGRAIEECQRVANITGQEAFSDGDLLNAFRQFLGVSQWIKGMTIEDITYQTPGQMKERAESGDPDLSHRPPWENEEPPDDQQQEEELRR